MANITATLDCTANNNIKIKFSDGTSTATVQIDDTSYLDPSLSGPGPAGKLHAMLILGHVAAAFNKSGVTGNVTAGVVKIAHDDAKGKIRADHGSTAVGF